MTKILIGTQLAATLKEEANHFLENPDKIRGLKDNNKFKKVPKETRNHLTKMMNSHAPLRLDWNFEYFHSAEPVGLHTDYDMVNWDEKTDCLVTHGIIIPLEWNCKQPYTITYNQMHFEPTKLMHKDGQMRYMETYEPIGFTPEPWFDEEVEKYNPKGSLYHNQYEGLKVAEAYEWEMGTAMFFDTRIWHSSSWFLDTNTIEENSSVYKRMIVGFGSVDVQRY